jgi:hypothetical protein
MVGSAKETEILRIIPFNNKRFSIKKLPFYFYLAYVNSSYLTLIM